MTLPWRPVKGSRAWWLVEACLVSVLEHRYSLTRRRLGQILEMSLLFFLNTWSWME